MMAWYHTPGPDQDVAVFTELQCLRNIAALPFSTTPDAGRARTLIADVGHLLTPNGFTDTELCELPRAAAYALAERRYIHTDAIAVSRPHALFVNEPCGLSVTVGAKEHITITALRAGAAISEAYAAVSSTEALVDGAFELAFDEKLGYLTSDPAEVGTGLRLSVVLCMPVSVFGGELAAVARRMAMSGIWLSVPSSEHALVRLSLSRTLGRSEEELVETVTAATGHLIDIERNRREGLSGEARLQLEDRVRRSYALLSAGVRLSPSEAVARLTDLRLGAAWGILPQVKVETLTASLMETMPAGLSLLGTDEHADESMRTEDARRGACVCERIGSALG